MIVRRIGSDLLLIAQLEHSKLAGRIMTAWRADGFLDRPTRARVLEATSVHDQGWRQVDAAPIVDPETGTPYDVVNAPLEIRQGAFPRAVEELARQDPYIAALVAQHAVTVYRRYDTTPEWTEFFPRLERRRDELLAETQPLDFETFMRDYAIVRIGDRWSLVFCNGWLEPNEMLGYTAQLHGSVPAAGHGNGDSDGNGSDSGTVNGGWLQITPDPFAGAIVPIDVPAWRIPARRYASDADLRDAVAQAPVIRLAGVIAGSAPVPEIAARHHHRT